MVLCWERGVWDIKKGRKQTARKRLKEKKTAAVNVSKANKINIKTMFLIYKVYFNRATYGVWL